MGYVFWVSLFSMAKQFGPLSLYRKDKSAANSDRHVCQHVDIHDIVDIMFG